MKRMPSVIRPMFCLLVDEPASAGLWMYEMKWDGERCVAFVTGAGKKRSVRLQSRTLKDATRLYPELLEDLGKCGAKEAILDGEIVAFDKKGRVSFEALQGRFGRSDADEIEALRRANPVVYMAFDLLWLDGQDLRNKPLAERRALLQRLVRGCKRVKFSQEYTDAKTLMRSVKKIAAEGIVAKERDSKYVEGQRGRHWLKIKITNQQECVVGGWTEGQGNRAGVFGALMLGVYEKRDGKLVLVPVGSVGTGFDYATSIALMKKLRPLERQTSPFAEPAKPNGVPHWVKPKLVAQIKFANWTSEGHLRAPVYLGLRDDKEPKDCIREIV